MSEIPRLAEVLAEHRFDDSMDEEIFCHEADDSPMVGMKRGPNPQADWQEWVDHFADAWMTACTITTVEQLDALPHGSLVIRKYTSPAGWKLHEVWERRNDMWYCLAAPLIPPSGEYGTPQLDDTQLIWSPDWERP